ncbi:MAG: hypothetical protein ABSE56_10740 [Bryobacteraceae bacterium]
MTYPKSKMSTGTTVAAVLTMIVSSAVGLPAQTAPDAATDLYYLSMGACLQARAEHLRTPGTSTDYSTVIVRDDMEITHGLPASVGVFRIEYLDYAALKQRYTRSKAEFPAIAIAPMKNRGNLLIVRCWDYRVSVRGRKLVLGVAGGWDVQWRYDCTSGKYAVVNVERWTPRM